jgi:hypothetical protein
MDPLEDFVRTASLAMQTLFADPNVAWRVKRWSCCSPETVKSWTFKKGGVYVPFRSLSAEAINTQITYHKVLLILSLINSPFGQARYCWKWAFKVRGQPDKSSEMILARKRTDLCGAPPELGMICLGRDEGRVFHLSFSPLRKGIHAVWQQLYGDTRNIMEAIAEEDPEEQTVDDPIDAKWSHTGKYAFDIMQSTESAPKRLLLRCLDKGSVRAEFELIAK